MPILDPNTFAPQDKAVDDETLALIAALLQLLGKPAGLRSIEVQVLAHRQAVKEYRESKG